MIIFDRQDELSAWIADKTDGAYSIETGRFIGYQIGGKIAAVVACTDYNGASCQYHIAIDTIAPVPFLEFCFDYGFNQLGLNKILTVIDGNNDKSLRFSQKLGFEIAKEIEQAGKNGKSLYIMSMSREQCKFLK